MVLQVFREHQLYARLSNCIFYQRNIYYLGHIISTDGIIIDLERIKAIRVCLVPKIVIEVKSYMGLIGYYQIFIKGFSKIASTISFFVKEGT
jgi:hypothetical protein